MTGHTSYLLSRRRVLVVDDYPELASLVQEYLEELGAFVCTTNDGASAMRMLQTDDFDIVVLDLRMSGVDGWDILKFLHCVRPSLLDRTIVMTGDRFRPVVVPKLQQLPGEVLFKPFALDDLRQAACRALYRSQTAAMSV